MQYILGVLGSYHKVKPKKKRKKRKHSTNCTIVIVSIRGPPHHVTLLLFRGLLGAHSVALTLQDSGKGMAWYNNELLVKAIDLADRLLAAFNTTTGIPYPKVTLLSFVLRSETILSICYNCIMNIIFFNSLKRSLQSLFLFERSIQDNLSVFSLFR